VNYYQNFYNDMFGTDKPNPKVLNWFKDNDNWTRQQVAKNNATDPLWYQVVSW